AYLRGTFTLAAEVVHARVAALADFCEAEWFLNGRSLGSMEDYGAPLYCDVTDLLVAGANTFAVEAAASEGPSAVAMMLELQHKDGSRQDGKSQRNWQAGNAPLAG